MYYDAYRHLTECETLSNRIEKLKSELKALKRYPSQLGRYTPYFTIRKHEMGSGFEFSVDPAKVDEARKNKGFFLLFTTDMEASGEQTLATYRAKDADEKLFQQIKVYMDGNRIRTHNEQTTEGKMFVIFLACVIRSYLVNQLSSYLNEQSTSMKKVFNQLNHITVISRKNRLYLNNALTKQQKLILDAFGLSDEILQSLT